MQSVVLQLRSLTITQGVAKSCQRINVGFSSNMFQIPSGNLTAATGSFVPVAQISFYKGNSQDTLWKTMSGVSSQGKRRGRARRLLKQKNLNKGQIQGYGPQKIDFPGLTSKIFTGTGINSKQRKIGDMSDESYNKYVEGLDTIKEFSAQRRQKRRVSPLERGWVGSKPPGRRYGSPVSTNQELKFENFDSILLEFKQVFHMTGILGRVRRTSALMVTGNGNGTFGYTLTAGKYGNNISTFRSAVNKAGLRLVNIERFEDRTVFHDFFTQYRHTRIFVEQRPFGYGVKAHRAIQAICEMAGIKDLYAKIEGSTNVQSITQAFMLGLLRQKSHQALANEKQLHLVEMRPEEDFYPRLIASPSDGKVRTQAEIGHNEVLDFEMIAYEGNLPSERVAKKNPWVDTPGWDKHMRRSFAYESHERVRRRMRVENGYEKGAVRSHLADKYPECVGLD